MEVLELAFKGMPMFRAFRTLFELSLFAVLVSACTGWDSAAPAAETEVVFDLPTSVVCRDITPESFAQANSDQRVFEARVEVSIRVKGDEQQIREMTIEFASPERRWQVSDYYPRTTLESEFAEPICVTKTHEKSRTFGATLSAGLPVPLGPVVATVTPGINGSKTGRDVVTETSKKIAPKKPVIVSGTLDQGHGVFFEWKPSTQDTWSGSRVHVIRFIAGDNWQADWAQLTCRADVATQGGMFKKSSEVREITRTVGLHRLGSRRAALAVERLSSAQSHYWKAMDAEHARQSKSLFGLPTRSGSKDMVNGRSADDWQTEMLEARRTLATLSGGK